MVAVGPHRMYGRVATDRAPRGRPPVILLHGLGIGGRYMLPLGRRLARHFPVFIPDLPGYGDSSMPARLLTLPELADVLRGWMEAIGVARAAVIANSFGCQVAVELAVLHPAAVERLVLQGPTVDVAARSLWAQFLRLLANARREPHGMGAIARRDWARVGLRRFIAMARQAIADRMEDKLPRVAAPTLVVRGEHDPLASPAWVELVAGRLPRGRLVTVAGASHTLNFFHPDALAALVVPFLRTDRPE